MAGVVRPGQLMPTEPHRGSWEEESAHASYYFTMHGTPRLWHDEPPNLYAHNGTAFIRSANINPPKPSAVVPSVPTDVTGIDLTWPLFP